MGLLSKLKKKVVDVGKKVVTVQAGVLTAGLVKPQVLGIKSKDNQQLFDNVGKVTKVAVGATGLVLAGPGLAAPLAGALTTVKNAVTGGSPPPPVTTSLGKTLQTFVEAQAPSTQVVRNAMEMETPLASTFDPIATVAGLPVWVKWGVPVLLVLGLAFRLGRAK